MMLLLIWHPMFRYRFLKSIHSPRLWACALQSWWEQLPNPEYSLGGEERRRPVLLALTLVTFVGGKGTCQTAGGSQHLKGLLTVHIAFIPACLRATKSKLRIPRSLGMGIAEDSSLAVKCELPWWQHCCCCPV